jgi:hypothetical protein
MGGRVPRFARYLIAGERMSEQPRGVSRRRVITTAVASSAYSGFARASDTFRPYLSLHETARRIAAREVSPVELTREMLARIAAIDPVLKSYRRSWPTEPPRSRDTVQRWLISEAFPAQRTRALRSSD